jgi:membrane fusion protein, heavy metal efflux system
MGWLIGDSIQASPASEAEGHNHHNDEGIIKLSEQQIAASGIEVEQMKPGTLSRRRFVPGQITPSSDRIARVAVRLLGTVVELRKRLGDPVEKNEVVAVIESREVADAKSEYLATRLTDELQQTLFARATSMWQAKVKTETEIPISVSCRVQRRHRIMFQDARVHLKGPKLWRFGHIPPMPRSRG